MKSENTWARKIEPRRHGSDYACTKLWQQYSERKKPSRTMLPWTIRKPKSCNSNGIFFYCGFYDYRFSFISAAKNSHGIRPGREALIISRIFWPRAHCEANRRTSRIYWRTKAIVPTHPLNPSSVPHQFSAAPLHSSHAGLVSLIIISLRLTRELLPLRSLLLES